MISATLSFALTAISLRLKSVPDWFLKSFNERTGAHLLCRDRTQNRSGVASVLEALKHYHKIGAFLGVRVRTLYFSSYIDYCLLMRLIIILVIMDNEAAENAVEIDEFCNSIGVLVLNFPAYLGHFLNICDNRVHATIQKYLDKIQAFYGTDTSLEQKYSAFVDAYAYASVTKDEVLNSLQSIR